jgi:wee1-like protein kinase
MPILADCSSKGLESAEFSFDHQISPVQFGSLIPDDSEEENLM